MDILVVEDDPIAIKIAGLIIARSNPDYKFSVVTTGAQAIDACNTQQFDLILLDIGLPDADGFTVSNQIRDSKFNCRTPIYALSAHIKSPFELEETNHDSTDGFITKPLSFEKLKDVITQVQSEISTT